MADQIPPTNPWLYQAWAARQPGNTANQWEGIATFGQNPSQDADLMATYRGAFNDNPLWNNLASQTAFYDNNADESTNPSRTNTGAGLDFSPLKGYTISRARGNDNNRLYGIFDPQGNLISGSIEGLTNDSLHHEDWADIAKGVAFVATAAYGGPAGLGSALSGGSFSGAGAAALAGGVTGGVVGGLEAGNLQGAAKGALTGAVVGGASQVAGDYLRDAAGSYFGPSDPNYSHEGLSGRGNLNGINSTSLPPITDLATGQPVDQFTTQTPSGNNFSNEGRPGTGNLQGINATGTENNITSLSDASDLNYRNGSDIASDNAIPGQPGSQTLTSAPATGVGPTTPTNPVSTPIQDALTKAAIGTGVTLAAGKLNDPGDPPTLNKLGGDAGTASRDAIISRLENQLWGTDAASGPDFSGVPALKTTAGDPNSYYQQAADASYHRAKTYLDPEIANRQQALEARLSEQGFVPGTPGYARAMQTFQDTTNRAYSDARDSSIQQGVTAGQNLYQNNYSNAQLNNSANNTAFQQAVTKRAIPFNEYSTLRTGASTDANQAYANAMAQYNAKVASSNATTQAVGNVVSAGLNTFVPSDARLKTDIVFVGKTAGGNNLYAYTIFGHRDVGVIAQEVLLTQPTAVQTDHPSGYLHVNYSEVK